MVSLYFIFLVFSLNGLKTFPLWFLKWKSVLRVEARSPFSWHALWSSRDELYALRKRSLFYWSLLYESVVNFLFRKGPQYGVLLCCYLLEWILGRRTCHPHCLPLSFLQSCARSCEVENWSFITLPLEKRRELLQQVYPTRRLGWLWGNFGGNLYTH